MLNRLLAKFGPVVACSKNPRVALQHRDFLRSGQTTVESQAIAVVARWRGKQDLAKV